MAELRLGENIVVPAIVVGGGEIKNQDKTITENGQYTADAGYTGLGTVTVNVPTGGIPNYIAPKNNVNGVYKPDNTATSFSLNGATDVEQYALPYAFYDCTNLASLDLSSLTTISGSYGMYYCFYNCTNLASLDLSSLTTISGSYGMYYCFYNCTNLASVDLSSLTTISGSYGINNCFCNCTSLTSVNLSSLTTISGSNGMYHCFRYCTNLVAAGLSSLATISGGYGMSYCFNGCTNLISVDLSSLAEISGISAMSGCFGNCKKLTELRFPALKSFGTNTTVVNQFNTMLSGVTGCTLHFPSNMQSEVERRTGYPNFGGTNTVVLFDLPATA